MARILAAYTIVWINGAFTGKVGGPLLQGQEPSGFPEVSVVTKSNLQKRDTFRDMSPTCYLQWQVGESGQELPVFEIVCALALFRELLACTGLLSKVYDT
jgi:hypothetical protein